MTPGEFGRKVTLADVAKANPAVKELYGTTELVVDEAALGKLLQAQGLTEGLDQVLVEVETRLETLRLRNRP